MKNSSLLVKTIVFSTLIYFIQHYHIEIVTWWMNEDFQVRMKLSVFYFIICCFGYAMYFYDEKDDSLFSDLNKNSLLCILNIWCWIVFVYKLLAVTWNYIKEKLDSFESIIPGD